MNMRWCAAFLVFAVYAALFASVMDGWWRFAAAAAFVVLVIAAVLRWVAVGGLDGMVSEDDR